MDIQLSLKTLFIYILIVWVLEFFTDIACAGQIQLAVKSFIVFLIKT